MIHCWGGSNETVIPGHMMGLDKPILEVATMIAGVEKTRTINHQEEDRFIHTFGASFIDLCFNTFIISIFFYAHSQL